MIQAKPFQAVIDTVMDMQPGEACLVGAGTHPPPDLGGNKYLLTVYTQLFQGGSQHRFRQSFRIYIGCIKDIYPVFKGNPDQLSCLFLAKFTDTLPVTFTTESHGSHA